MTIDKIKAKYSNCSINMGGDFRMPVSVLIDDLLGVVRDMIRREVNTIGVFNQMLDDNEDCWSA